MSDLRAIIEYQHENVSTSPGFLEARRKAETKARNMLDKKAGRFTEDDFQLFFELCNTERVPPNVHTVELNEHETITRFGLAFRSNNKKLMLESLDELNRWTLKLWANDDPSLNILERFWFPSHVKGAGISFPTMIMYLKNPDCYVIWLESLTKNLSKFTNQEVPMRKSSRNYLEYNKIVDSHLRKPFNLQPQEIDYLIFYIGRTANTTP